MMSKRYLYFNILINAGGGFLNGMSLADALTAHAFPTAVCHSLLAMAQLCLIVFTIEVSA